MDNARAAALFAAPAAKALEAFPITPVRIELVTVSENVTFQVTDVGGDAFVLRLHRPGYHSLDELTSERLWTRALNEAGLPVPRAIETLDGRAYAPVEIPATGETRFAGVLAWTPGQILSDVMAREADDARLSAWFGELGAIMGALHVQAAAWTPPAGFTRHHLDIDGLMGEAPFWGRFWESSVFEDHERALVLRARETIRTALSVYGRTPGNYSVIHADLHPGNILIDGGRLTVIDFDDAGFGWRMYDAAVVLFYHQQHASFPTLREAFFRGYRKARPLAPHDEAMLPIFLLTRGLAQIGWYHQRPELRGDDHRRAVAATKARVLEQCAALENRDIVSADDENVAKFA